MAEIDDLLMSEFKKLPPKPADDAKQTDKKRYSELMSAAAAVAFGEALRRKGLKGTLPVMSEPEDLVAVMQSSLERADEEISQEDGKDDEE